MSRKKENFKEFIETFNYGFADNSKEFFLRQCEHYYDEIVDSTDNKDSDSSEQSLESLKSLERVLFNLYRDLEQAYFDLAEDKAKRIHERLQKLNENR